MFKMTGINLELFTDIDMYQMVEKGKRGGISYIVNRYSKPNNKYICDYGSFTKTQNTLAGQARKAPFLLENYVYKVHNINCKS